MKNSVIFCVKVLDGKYQTFTYGALTFFAVVRHESRMYRPVDIHF